MRWAISMSMPPEFTLRQKSLLSKLVDWNIFAYNHSKFAAGISESLGIANAFQSFNGKRTTSANTALESLLLSNAVCVPCHSASPVWKHAAGYFNFERAKYCEGIDEKAFAHLSAGGFSGVSSIVFRVGNKCNRLCAGIFKLLSFHF